MAGVGTGITSVPSISRAPTCSLTNESLRSFLSSARVGASAARVIKARRRSRERPATFEGLSSIASKS